jgi:hypothetical protein
MSTIAQEVADLVHQIVRCAKPLHEFECINLCARLVAVSATAHVPVARTKREKFLSLYVLAKGKPGKIDMKKLAADSGTSYSSAYRWALQYEDSLADPNKDTDHKETIEST